MPTLAITSTPDAFDAAAKVLLHSLNRGDFDEDPDFDDAAGRACGAFAQAADDAWDTAERALAKAQADLAALDEV